MNDVKAALRSMGLAMLFFSIFAARILGTLILASTILFLAVYLTVHFTWIVSSIMFVGAMCFWFKIELDDARSIREYEEMKKEKKNGKS